MMEIINLLQSALSDPWSLLFLAVWGVGWYLKTYTTVKPQWALPPLGIALGLALIELSLGGAIVGFVISLAQMGFYDVIKPLMSGGPKITHSDGIGADTDDPNQG